MNFTITGYFFDTEAEAIMAAHQKNKDWQSKGFSSNLISVEKFKNLFYIPYSDIAFSLFGNGYKTVDVQMEEDGSLTIKT